jgi:hypothetical protein
VRVLQVRRAQPAQRLPGGDGRHVRRTTGQPREGRRTLQRRAEEGLLADPPHPRRPIQQCRPLRAGARTEGAVQRGGDRVRGPGDGEPRAVGEPVRDRGVQPHQVDGVLQRTAGRGEEVAVDLREGDQARAGVERVTVPGVPAELPADPLRLLEDGHPMTGRGQSGRRGETTQPGTHDRHPCHPATVSGAMSAFRVKIVCGVVRVG